MKKWLSVILSLVLLLSAVSVAFPAWAASAQSVAQDGRCAYRQGEAVAILKTSAAAYKRASSSLKSSAHITMQDYSVFSDSAVQRYAADGSKDDLVIASFSSDTYTTEQLVDLLEKDTLVEAAQPNYIYSASSVTEDTYSDWQWALKNTGQNAGTADADTHAQALWSQSATEEEAVVAVVDTGIDYNHEDLKSCLWVNPYGSKLAGTYGYDFSGTIADGSPLDDNGHGSHVAGIIAAQGNNQTGISGLNPSGVKIMALKFLDVDGYGDTYAAVAAYEYIYRAISLGTNVVAINNSWGGYEEEPDTIFGALFDRLGAAGAISVCAAGNEAVDLQQAIDEEGAYSSPATVDSDYKIVVAASNERDELASFSCRSSKYVDMAAPGTNILSCVSYDCFNPTIYTPEQRARLCAGYTAYDSFGTADQFGHIRSANVLSAEISADTFFGLDGTSLKLTIANDDQDYYAAFPYSVSAANARQQVSLMLAANTTQADFAFYAVPASVDLQTFMEGKDVDSFDYYIGDIVLEDDLTDWTHLEFSIAAGSETDYNLVFVMNGWSGINEETGESDAVTPQSSFYIDDFAISCENPDTAQFGTYDFYSGTSMAAPYVSGAVAFLSRIYPQKAAAELRHMVISSGRTVSALADQTRSGKVLDLQDVTAIAPSVTSVTMNKSKRLTVTGYGFVLNGIPASVSINGKTINPVSITEKTMELNCPSSINEKSLLTVTNANGTDTYELFISDGKPYTDLGATSDFDGTLLSTGSMLIGVGSDGSLYQYDPFWYSEEGFDDYGDYDMADDDSSDAFSLSPAGVMDVESIAASRANGMDVKAVAESACYCQGNVYAVFALQYMTSTDAVIGTERIVVQYNLNSEKTKYVADVPNNDLEGSILASYNGAVYLIGGYDSVKHTFSTKCSRLSGNRFDAAPSLPEGRAYGQAVQSGNTLCYLFGANAQGTVPAPLRLTGSSWQTSAAAIRSEDATPVTASDRTQLQVYKVNTGVVKDGVLCAGVFLYGMSDTVIYRPSSDTFAATGYNFTLDDTVLNGAVLDDTFYGIAGVYGEDGANYHAYSLPVSSGLLSVDASAMKHCSVDTDQTAYLPGETAKISVVPDSGYKLTALTVNGKAYTSGTASVRMLSNAVVKGTTQKIAPGSVANFRVSAASASAYNLQWDKRSGASGYQIQQYKDKKWKTVKTITSGKTVLWKVTKFTAGTQKYRIRAYTTYNGKKYYSGYTTLKFDVPGKAAIQSVKSGKKKCTVKWKKQTSKTTGFQIQYSTSSNFKNAKTVTIKKKSAVSKTISKLTSGKKYYIRIRAYKTVGKVKVYGAWSAKKSVTVK